MIFQKIYAWVFIVVGALACFGSFDGNDLTAFAGGIWIIVGGAVILDIINKLKKYETTPVDKR